MRTAFVVVAAVVASCILVSCGPKPPDMAALKKTVDDYNAASRGALMGGNMDAPVAFFTDDGLEMAPNMATAKGKDAIKAMWTQMMSSGAKMTAVDFTTTDLQAGGTVAYEIGTYAMTISVPGMGEIKDVGKYVSLWRQQADGTWKLRAETWNTDTPMPPMEKPATKKK
jgi:ketosteroid isomerase-like protein